ncbi:MAG: recombination protein O N-terminal domain-containing protein [Opitutales bacterium]|nr:recombination protein O N-terminal domain-containing protein [Opitutales bacterium]
MSPSEWQGDGLILRKDPHGESYLKLLILSPEWGLMHVLLRFSSGSSRKRSSGMEPDLFDEIHARFAPAKNQQLAFIQEWQLVHRLSGLGSSYQRLLWAVKLVQAFIPNLAHIEETEWTYGLLRKSLRAMAGKDLPEASYCKALFLFAREQGYPVAEAWLNRHPTQLQLQALELLQKPLHQIQIDPGVLKRIRLSLEGFLRANSDFEIPEERNQP